MDESKPSDETAPKRGRGLLSDLVAGAGVIALTSGAYLFHPGFGLMVLGMALMLIGTRGLAPGG